MTPEYFLKNALIPALRLLPDSMDSQEARAELLAIGLQESGFKDRAQIHGPAHSFFQMEQGGGVRGVLNHPVTQPLIRSVLDTLEYPLDASPEVCWNAIEHNDILAACFARLLLYTLPYVLPARNAPAVGWSQYTAAWRPGKPRRESWDAFFTEAWEIVTLEA